MYRMCENKGNSLHPRAAEQLLAPDGGERTCDVALFLVSCMPAPAAGEVGRYIARLMKASAISKPFVVSLVATPLVLLAAVASAGAGHGNYLLAKILFPFTMLSTLVFGSLIAPAIVLAVFQFPFYGFILGRANVKGSLRLRAAVLLLIHVLAVAACFILIGDNFS